jgi:hypothetical protein
MIFMLVHALEPHSNNNHISYGRDSMFSLHNQDD